ncbi:MAG: Arc family DNA-binding protein [Planctomycetes bacterium]|nr:Arc family DNA-binding protein [Planctomycetota bacterium]MBI3844758.1 Arc family DNA-binding protein [Planctomycetota bacterium]
MAERKPFVLRLPEDLFRELQAWAEQELRSVNGQIEYILREAAERRRSERRKR